MKIGEYFLERGILTAVKVEEILDLSGRTGLRFGESAVKLQFLTREKIIQAFDPKSKSDLFSLDPKYYAQIDLKVLTPKDMIKYGAVLLGMKNGGGFFSRKKILNIGLLEPKQAEALKEVEAIARNKLGNGAFEKTKVFLIFADQLLEVLRSVYGVQESEIRSMQDVHRVLSMFVR